MDGLTIEVVGVVIAVLLTSMVTGIGFMLNTLSQRVSILEKEKADVESVIEMKTKINEILQHVLEIKVEQAEWRGRLAQQSTIKLDRS